MKDKKETITWRISHDSEVRFRYLLLTGKIPTIKEVERIRIENETRNKKII
jgi:hypothetical protein